MFSVASVIPSIVARYSINHLEEEATVITTAVNKVLYYFISENAGSNVVTLTAAPWYQNEDNLIILFQGIALLLALLSIVFSFFAVISREKSIFYASSILIAAFSLYFINAKLALFVIFIAIILIMQLRKKFGLYT